LAGCGFLAKLLEIARLESDRLCGRVLIGGPRDGEEISPVH
jgi:hypothetical protein